VKLPAMDIQNRAGAATGGADARALADQAARAEGNDRAGLKHVAKQFESLFYGQLLKSMRSTVPDNGFWGQSGGTKIYRQLHDQELANRLADQGGLGIADLIVKQFETSLPDDAMGPPEITNPLTHHGLQTYRRVSGQTGADDLVRLRQLAQGMGGTVADTLGRYEDDLVAAAREHDLDPALVLAVTVRESAGDARAVSPAGAQGLMQLMPGTAADMGVGDAHDPAQNLRGGSRYLSTMLQRYDGDLDLALAAYNAGPGNVDRAGRAIPPFRETQDYVAAVKDLAHRLGAAPSGTNLVTDTPVTVTPTSEAR